jgi:cell division transport system permease protein
MKQSIHQYIQPLESVFSKLRHHIVSTLLMFAVIGVALSLPSILLTLADNVSTYAKGLKEMPQISLYLKLTASKNDQETIDRRLKQDTRIAQFKLISKEEAWETFKKNPNTSDVAKSLDTNPLPDTFEISPKTTNPQQIEALQSEMKSWPAVEFAKTDADWIKRLDAFLTIAKRGAVLLMILLGIGLVTIIGNSIRLQMLTHKEEIEVSQLIGATHAFIRRPFLYAGMIYGLGGAVVAVLITDLVVAIFNQSISKLAPFYFGQNTIHFPSLLIITSILLAGLFMGWVGAFVSIHQSLSRIEKQ